MPDQPADTAAQHGVPASRNTDEERIRELIHRRRRQVLVHSILYYKLDQTLIADAQFD